ncbi:Probable periplasmic protein Cj0776c [Campylobacter insulaenigrae]|uniref:OmpA family protein n=1 Tax=Campylobacter insulaenigrae TaxID=260714 RepID=UPI000F6B57FA|nr:OmpA family protein [Campylobacter insulaenigrae]MCR6590577.1 OmpA family protein [Campylobacter insulaenigrae]MCR6592114.1 OmpA family protein [Campylobacter insulaenigrae]VEJ53479.1 Probable periplasmic protein Cj0776c [Campylobacter insulaenigrae]
MKGIIALGAALIILLGASIGFYIWYFNDEKTYVYDYTKDKKTYENYSNANQNYNNTQSNNAYDLNSNNSYQTAIYHNEEKDIQEEKHEQDYNLTTTPITQNKTDQEKLQYHKTNNTNTNEKINKNTQISSKKQNIKTNIMQEYIEKGKTSKYEKKLSNEFVKVYVLDGKTLSDYRISLLSEMIRPIAENSQDYNLTIFIQMLPNDNMNLSVYNKDIVFEKNKKKYNYVDMKIEDFKFLFERNGYDKYSNEDILQQIDQKLARENVLKRIKIQGYADDRGSSFANYMIGLNRAMNVAKHFFAFTELIEIQSFGKENYPLKDKSDQQRQDNRKVEISFYN